MAECSTRLLRIFQAVLREGLEHQKKNPHRSAQQEMADGEQLARRAIELMREHAENEEEFQATIARINKLIEAAHGDFPWYLIRPGELN